MLILSHSILRIFLCTVLKSIFLLSTQVKKVLGFLQDLSECSKCFMRIDMLNHCIKWHSWRWLWRWLFVWEFWKLLAGICEWDGRNLGALGCIQWCHFLPWAWFLSFTGCTCCFLLELMKTKLKTRFPIFMFSRLTIPPPLYHKMQRYNGGSLLICSHYALNLLATLFAKPKKLWYHKCCLSKSTMQISMHDM